MSINTERTKSNEKVTRMKALHRYYSYTGFYSFIGNSVKKALLPIILFVVAIFLVNKYVISFSDILKTITETYSTISIFAIFFTSESILGLVPPEAFIYWAGKSVSPWGFLSILALLSYMGGIMSFFIGRGIASIPSVNRYFETKMKSHLENMRKWGGFLIIVGALLPLPFSMACIAAGMIDYKLKNVILFGLLRFLRFAIYGLLIFSVSAA